VGTLLPCCSVIFFIFTSISVLFIESRDDILICYISHNMEGVWSYKQVCQNSGGDMIVWMHIYKLLANEHIKSMHNVEFASVRP
jgi:hypothetical protein